MMNKNDRKLRGIKKNIRPLITDIKIVNIPKRNPPNHTFKVTNIAKIKYVMVLPAKKDA